MSTETCVITQSRLASFGANARSEYVSLLPAYSIIAEIMGGFARICRFVKRITHRQVTKIMSEEKWIVSDKDYLGGKPRVRGTRISIAFLLDCLANGMSVAEILDAYPTLTANAVRGALHELAQEMEAAAA